MTHSDDAGLVLPPKLAPIEVVLVPIYKGEEQMAEIVGALQGIADDLKSAGLRVKVDDDDSKRSGWKFAEYELKGVPVRLAMGPRDLAGGTVEVARRDTRTKEIVPMEGIQGHVQGLLKQIQQSLFERAEERRTSTTTRVDTWEEFLAALEAGGFVEAHWDGTSETEDLIKKETKATIRCIPLDAPEEKGVCIKTGAPSSQRVVFARAY
jgi:prolyl-tRNA synthetase